MTRRNFHIFQRTLTAQPWWQANQRCARRLWNRPVILFPPHHANTSLRHWWGWEAGWVTPHHPGACYEISNKICIVFVIIMSPGLNSSVPERSGCHFKDAIFINLALWIVILWSYDDTHSWMPRDLTDGKSTWVQVMTWCRQAASHYLSQCWPCPRSPNGITKPHWVNGPTMTYLPISDQKKKKRLLYNL